jgi:hypothetical protein
MPTLEATLLATIHAAQVPNASPGAQDPLVDMVSTVCLDVST